MKRFCLLLLTPLLLLSLGIGPVAHAMEAAGGCGDAAWATLSHTDGKIDHGENSAAPHQHGCHGHHLTVIPDMAIRIAVFVPDDAPFPGIAADLLRGSAGPALRPPIS